MTHHLPPCSAEELTLALGALSERYYVYVLHRPDGSPFYVGKGIGSRCLHHEKQAQNTTLRSHKLNLIRHLLRSGLRVRYAIDSVHVREEGALARECELIRLIGRHDLGRGPLTNQTDGGEGTSNPSEESLRRRGASLGGEADDPDRRAAIEFFRLIGGVNASVPVKPIAARRLEWLTPHTSPRSPTRRMAWALAAAAMAQNALLAPGARLRRTFTINGVLMAIENGVARDMLKARMIDLADGANSPADVAFIMTSVGVAASRDLIGRAKLLDLGLIEP